MPEFFNQIPDDPKLIQWIQDQKLFHVASAPLNGGRVNISPKGYSSFKIVSRKACWYLDLTGSGNETISHIYEPGNGRVTIMFEAFEGPPQIVRLFGKGKVYERGTPEFDKFFEPHSGSEDEIDYPTPELIPGARAVIWLDIQTVSTSCGFSVPFMEYIKDREQLLKVSTQLENADAACEDPYKVHYEKSMKSWRVTMNSWSIDGLPGLLASNARASGALIRDTMLHYNLDPPSSPTFKPNYRTISAFLIGLCLGVAATSLVRERGVLASSLLLSYR